MHWKKKDLSSKQEYTIPLSSSLSPSRVRSIVSYSSLSFFGRLILDNLPLRRTEPKNKQCINAIKKKHALVTELKNKNTKSKNRNNVSRHTKHHLFWKIRHFFRLQVHTQFCYLYLKMKCRTSNWGFLIDWSIWGIMLLTVNSMISGRIIWDALIMLPTVVLCNRMF